MSKQIRFGDLARGKAFLIENDGPYLKVLDIYSLEMKALSLVTFSVFLCSNDLLVEPVSLTVEKEEIFVQ